MDVTSRLAWLRLSTTSMCGGDRYSILYDLELHPELQGMPSLSHTSPPEGTTDRWSPIFLVGDSTSLSSFDSRLTGTLWLLYDTKPVQLAAVLANRIPAGYQHAVCLTHGLASVLLLIHPDPPLVDLLAQFAERTQLRAIERWNIVDGRIIDQALLHDTSGSRVTSEQAGGASRSLGETPRGILRQIQDNRLVVEQVTDLCCRYRPSYRKGLRDLLTRSAVMVEQIDAAGNDTADKYGASWQVLWHNAHSLVHLNSMLAYLVSQGLGGAPPVLQNHSLIPSYSLFGVATAYKAIWELTHFIEEGFLAFDIVSEMSNRYFNRTKEPADCAKNALFKPELDDMKAAAVGAHRKTPGHVNLFSGRLGFHSSSWAVAAPVDTLHEAASPAWNLLTLSHEMLHIHVDGLLSFVLSRNTTKEPDLSQDQLCLNMAQLARAVPAGQPIRIIDRIRQKIARYVLYSAACRGDDTKPLSQLPNSKSQLFMAQVTNPAEFRDMLVFCMKRLSEYIVHILDFYYFYWGDVDRFIALVWTSWSSIPSVYEDIGHYIMRSLLAVSTREMDPDTASSLMQPLDFQDSLDAFKKSIAKLPDSIDCRHIRDAVDSFLAEPDNREFLRLEFSRAKSLVWVTIMYFYSRPLRLYLEIGRSVAGGVVSDGELCPQFEFGGVQERLPASPIAFIAKYLSGDYEQPDGFDDLPTEAASIWLFSWLASCGQSEGGQNASGE
jgi:hypothetical protein